MYLVSTSYMLSSIKKNQLRPKLSPFIESFLVEIYEIEPFIGEVVNVMEVEVVREMQELVDVGGGLGVTVGGSDHGDVSLVSRLVAPDPGRVPSDLHLSCNTEQSLSLTHLVPIPPVILTGSNLSNSSVRFQVLITLLDIGSGLNVSPTVDNLFTRFILE